LVMHQPALQQNPQVTRLALAKFSHTTTPIDHNGPLAWTHVNGNGDVFCVLNMFICGPSVPPRLILKVVRNNSILEQIDLAYFARSAASQSGAVQDASLPKPLFAVVVKSPCLAVKYPQGGTHIRRFQIKFLRNSDYFTALALLSEINCPLTEGSTSLQAPQRPPSSSSWTSAQISTTASKDASTAFASNQTTPVPFFPMPGYIPGGVTSKCTSHNPPSSSSILHNLPGQTSPDLPGQGLEPAEQGPNPTAPLSQKCVEITASSSRPATAPAYHDQQLNRMLPPKRELPFSRSSSKRPRAESSNEAAPAPHIPPAPVAEQINGRRSKETSHAPVEPDLTPYHDSQVSDSQSQSLVPTQPLPDAVQISRISLEPQSTQPYPQCSTPMEPHSHAPLIPITPADPCVPGRQTWHAMESVEDQLSLYLTSPSAERVAFLENWMCELIEDDKFMALCQDVEATWRRFAFGVKK
ncbi:uncharacterized protein N7459_001283, partial [Penicillium hispanicum]|uniref:uncharacterized protein n=1 Tax=Penicillium hispanicum TaxID=1080232 RepID=UPI00253FD8B4